MGAFPRCFLGLFPAPEWLIYACCRWFKPLRCSTHTTRRSPAHTRIAKCKCSSSKTTSRTPYTVRYHSECIINNIQMSLVDRRRFKVNIVCKYRKRMRQNGWVSACNIACDGDGGGGGRNKRRNRPDRRRENQIIIIYTVCFLPAIETMNECISHFCLIIIRIFRSFRSRFLPPDGRVGAASSIYALRSEIINALRAHPDLLFGNSFECDVRMRAISHRVCSLRASRPHSGRRNGSERRRAKISSSLDLICRLR